MARALVRLPDQAGPHEDIDGVQAENTYVSFSIGETFESFEQLEGKIHKYEEQRFVKFWKRDCRTVAAAQRRINRALNEKN